MHEEHSRPCAAELAIAAAAFFCHHVRPWVASICRALQIATFGLLLTLIWQALQVMQKATDPSVGR